METIGPDKSKSKERLLIYPTLYHPSDTITLYWDVVPIMTIS
jgi:hypothetical protein